MQHDMPRVCAWGARGVGLRPEAGLAAACPAVRSRSWYAPVHAAYIACHMILLSICMPHAMSQFGRAGLQDSPIDPTHATRCTSVPRCQTFTTYKHASHCSARVYRDACRYFPWNKLQPRPQTPHQGPFPGAYALCALVCGAPEVRANPHLHLHPYQKVAPGPLGHPRTKRGPRGGRCVRREGADTAPTGHSI